MNLRKALVCVSAALGMAAYLAGRGSSAANQDHFDKLSDTDRKVLAERFEKEIWPLLTKGGKDSCVSCHSPKGKIVSALKFTGDARKDFGKLVKDGFFLHGDEGSLLARVTDKNPERRMPLKKTPWGEKDIQVLRAFTIDVDKKQQK